MATVAPNGFVDNDSRNGIVIAPAGSQELDDAFLHPTRGLVGLNALRIRRGMDGLLE